MATPEGRERIRRSSRESRRRRYELSAESREAQKRSAREYQARRRADPEWRAKENARLRDRRAWLRENDPDGWLALCERDRRNHNRRMRNAKSRRRRDETARLAKADRAAKRLGDGYEYRPRGPALVDTEDGLLLEVGPFADYVEERLRGVDRPVFCNLVGNGATGEDRRPLDEAVLRRWLNREQERVQLDVVDRVLCAFGEPWLLDSLYPDVDERLAA